LICELHTPLRLGRCFKQSLPYYDCVSKVSTLPVRCTYPFLSRIQERLAIILQLLTQIETHPLSSYALLAVCSSENASGKLYGSPCAAVANASLANTIESNPWPSLSNSIVQSHSRTKSYSETTKNRLFQCKYRSRTAVVIAPARKTQSCLRIHCAVPGVVIGVGSGVEDDDGCGCEILRSGRLTNLTARGSTRTPTAIPAGTEGSAARAAMNKLAAPGFSPEWVVPKPTMFDDREANLTNPVLAIEGFDLGRLRTSRYL
jgi:hypothetical protein